MVYAGDSSTGSKVAEYGGNMYGIGGRSVVRLGWPKDVLKVMNNIKTLMYIIYNKIWIALRYTMLYCDIPCQGKCCILQLYNKCKT